MHIKILNLNMILEHMHHVATAAQKHKAVLLGTCT